MFIYYCHCFCFSSETLYYFSIYYFIITLTIIFIISLLAFRFILNDEAKCILSNKFNHFRLYLCVLYVHGNNSGKCGGKEIRRNKQLE